MYFPVNFVKFLRKPISIEHVRWVAASISAKKVFGLSVALANNHVE